MTSDITTTPAGSEDELVEYVTGLIEAGLDLNNEVSTRDIALAILGSTPIRRALDGEKRVEILSARNNLLNTEIDVVDAAMRSLGKQLADEGRARIAAEARVKELEAALTMGASLNTPNFLDWIADRLVYVYGESPNIDFVLSLRERASAARRALTDTTRGQNDLAGPAIAAARRARTKYFGEPK